MAVSKNFMSVLSSDKTTVPDIRELLNYIHLFLGGTEKYAEMLVDDVKAATEGSNQRLTFHNNYLNAIAKYGGNDDVNTADRAALEAEAQRLAKQLEEQGVADE